jgi:putative SOS response-associated peptidase YedK
MCGRYVSVARVAELIEQYKATGPGDDKQLAPSYNVAPTNKVHAVLERDRPDGTGAMREVAAVQWGLVPAWWKPGTGPKSGKARTMPMLHNARSDRVGHRAVVAGPVRQAPGGHPRRRVLRVAAHRGRRREPVGHDQ